MLFGIGLPQRRGFNLRDDVIRLSIDAEMANFDSLWVYERLLWPTAPLDGLFGIEGLPWAEAYQQAADPLTILAAAAAVTARIRLGTSVLVASLHQPLRLAKALATIDHLSGGNRLIAGLGNGWSADERLAVGEDGADRGAMLDETMAVLRAAWSEDPVSYSHPRSTVNSALLQPKPLGPIPLVLGGGDTPKALRRIARDAQGWMAVGMPAAQMQQTWEQVVKLAVGHGRDPGDLRLIRRANIILLEEPLPEEGRYPFAGNLDQIVADVVASAAAGADEILLEFQLQENFPADSGQLLDQALIIRERATTSIQNQDPK